MIEKILKPKTKEEIEDLFLGSPTIIQIIEDYELSKYNRVVKAYDYLATRLGDSPLNVHIFFSDTQLFDSLSFYFKISSLTNSVRERMMFLAGPFKHAIIWKNNIADVHGDFVSGIAVGKKSIFNYLKLK
jgi:hypothetical protein